MLQFTLAEHRVHGNAGCNVINGTFELDPQNPSALTFGPMITTMMACQNMDAETAVLQALAQVQSFRVAGEILYLCDASGSELLSLERTPRWQNNRFFEKAGKQKGGRHCAFRPFACPLCPL